MIAIATALALAAAQPAAAPGSAGSVVPEISWKCRLNEGASDEYVLSGVVAKLVGMPAGYPERVVILGEDTSDRFLLDGKPSTYAREADPPFDAGSHLVRMGGPQGDWLLLVLDATEKVFSGKYGSAKVGRGSLDSVEAVGRCTYSEYER
jgi:hypothetical protein